jgi:hypothetical protein
MKDKDLTPFLKNLLLHAGEKKDPLHAIRVTCKRSQALLLLAKRSRLNSSKEKEIELWLKIIHRTRKSLEEFREQDVLIDSSRKLLKLKQNESEHASIKKMLPIKAVLHSKALDQRKQKIQQAIDELKSLSERELQIISPLNLKQSYEKSYRLYKKCKHTGDEALFHQWRKFLILLKSQLETKLSFVSTTKRQKCKRYQKAINQIDKLKGLIGDERDAKALTMVLRKHRREIPQSLHLLKVQKKKTRKKIFFCAAKFFELR